MVCGWLKTSSSSSWRTTTRSSVLPAAARAPRSVVVPAPTAPVTRMLACAADAG